MRNKNNHSTPKRNAPLQPPLKERENLLPTPSKRGGVRNFLSIRVFTFSCFRPFMLSCFRAFAPSYFRAFALFLLLLCVLSANAQTFRFKNFDTNYGLPQNFVYCIEQCLDGFLWIGTGEGLVKFDGHRFQTFLTADSLADDFITSLFVAIDGKVWIGHNSGNLSYHYKNKIKPIIIPETQSFIRHICQDKDENIWAVDQNEGFIRIDKNKNTTTFFDKEKLGYVNFYSIYPLQENTLLVGTTDGLMTVKINNKDEIESVEKIDEIPQTIITRIVPRKGISGEYWIGTLYEGFFRYIAGSSKATQFIDNRLCLDFNIEKESIQDIFEEDEGHLLLATRENGVIKLFFDPVRQDFNESFIFSETNGLPKNYITDILCDREGNHWFATYGGGLSLLSDESMIFYDLDAIQFKNKKAYSVYKTQNSIYIGLDDGIIKADPFCYTDFEYIDETFGIPRDEIRGFYQSEDGGLWIATANQGLFFKKPDKRNFQPYNYSNNISDKKIRDIKGHKSKIFLATIGGYFEIDIDTGNIIHLTTERGLPHNNINFVYRDKQGYIWLGPKNSGICKIIENEKIDLHKISQTPIDVYGIAEDNNGGLWLATHSKGVLYYSEDSLSIITVTEGLAKNFCYSIVIDETNKLWVTHFPGLSCIDLNENKIRTYGYEDGFGADFYYSYIDKDNTIWFASSQGVLNYFPKKDVENLVPPKLNFTQISILKEIYEITNVIKLKNLGKKKYNIRLDFIGISFKNPKGVTYQYQLEKDGDKKSEWIDLPTTWWEREYMPDGQWTIRIRAFNSDGIFNSDPLTLRIHIAPPIWKKPWPYLVLLSVIIYLVYLIIHFREKKLKFQKELLQQEVANQTILLRQQKAEIERKNQDITDSINYAKRIQNSILPSVSVLESRFKESFLFFAPRDIVSGDFYWFYETKKKFLCACADCTGHGVPGAFMSMIGSTLLNDIVKRPEILSPADILNRLDFEIKILLQKNIHETSQDGMDISIVEIDLVTNNIRVASAKRPIFLFINNELTVYKGVRRSIGDQINEQNAPDFVNIEYQGNPKDTIYLFSDGYADQFGGKHGKKLMSSTVKTMLKEIHQKPMQEQYNIVKNTYLNWKDFHDQVDDVIFIGLKLQ